MKPDRVIGEAFFGKVAGLLHKVVGPLAVIAGAAWVICIGASIVGLLWVSLPPWLLEASLGICFALFSLSLVLIIHHKPRDFGSEDMFRAGPDWARDVVWASGGYTALMFCLLFIFKDNVGAMVGFSSVFFAWALAVFVTIAMNGPSPVNCENGHVLGAFDKFCPECGLLRPEHKNQKRVF
ncbi:MAG: hypothetical protein NVV62_17605 [Terricaulis sp.]|nr:hypothetical protein [Terricaulis sp.]